MVQDHFVTHATRPPALFVVAFILLALATGLAVVVGGIMLFFGVIPVYLLGGMFLCWGLGIISLITFVWIMCSGKKSKEYNFS